MNVHVPEPKRPRHNNDKTPLEEGSKFPTKHNGDITVVKYSSSRTIHIRFVNTGWETIVTKQQILKGIIRDRSINRRAGNTNDQINLTLHDREFVTLVKKLATQTSSSYLHVVQEMLRVSHEEFHLYGDDFIARLHSLPSRGRAERAETKTVARWMFGGIPFTILDCVHAVNLFEFFGDDSFTVSLKKLWSGLSEAGVDMDYNRLSRITQNMIDFDLLLVNKEGSLVRSGWTWFTSPKFVRAVNDLISSDYWMKHCNELYLQVYARRLVAEARSAEVHSVS
ncbi:hypothetical protein EVC12_237 [Rhizobium phage RHph_I42]|nr:hypothetical protein EVC12_237 [Rhizobium phage RHph_I42]